MKKKVKMAAIFVLSLFVAYGLVVYFARFIPGPYSLLVIKSERRLELLEGGRVIKSYPIALSSNLKDKEKEGDRGTPEGELYVCEVTRPPFSNTWIRINYPNQEDAERGLKAGMIGRFIYQRIKMASILKIPPPQSTSLGGAIGFHGGGIRGDWTAGCIGMKDEDILELVKMVRVGTPVFIHRTP